MSTNANIGIQLTDRIKAIYCHFDGNTLGPILKKYYNSMERATALINLGAISYLEKFISPDEASNKIPHLLVGYPQNWKHSFNTPMKDVTVAYHRDRNEDLCIDTYDTLKQFSRGGYNYLFINNQWNRVSNGKLSQI